MPTPKSIKNGLAIVLLALLATPALSQTSRRHQRALLERGTDSAWFYQPFWGRPRFYLGTDRVSLNEFENTLRNSDAMVDELITVGRRKTNVARYINYAAGVVSIGSVIALNSSYDNYNSYNRNTRISPGVWLLLGAGVALEGVALGFSIDGSNRFRNGLRQFNQKAKAGTLQPAEIKLGVTNHGIGIALKF